jgi:hypothetical protein
MTIATDLGYGKDTVVDYYQRMFFRIYSGIISIARTEHKPFTQSAQMLLSSNFNQSAGRRIQEIAQITELSGTELIKQLELELVHMNLLVESYWNKSRVYEVTRRESIHYFLVPFFAQLNLVNNYPRFWFLSKEITMTEVNFEVALLTQNQMNWQSVELQITQSGNDQPSQWMSDWTIWLNTPVSK